VLVGLIAVGATGFWLYRDYSLRVAEDTRRVEEAKRAAELQLKAQQEKAASTTTQNEAMLLAQIQSTKDTLAQAEANKQKAEQDRITAEAAQRQAKLQDDLKSAKDALQKAEVSEKKAEGERKAATTAMQSAESAVKKGAKEESKTEPVPTSPVASAELKASTPTAEPQPAMNADAPEGKGVDRFDGVYAGKMCSPHVDNSLRCWDTVVKAQHGTLSAAWPSAWSTQLARATGTISPEGAVEVALAGFKAGDGRPISGKMTGSWAGNTIRATGSWANGYPVTVAWKWAPGAPVPADTTQAKGAGSAKPDDADDTPNPSEPQMGRGRHRR
jgi:hypothetical protein